MGWLNGQNVKIFTFCGRHKNVNSAETWLSERKANGFAFRGRTLHWTQGGGLAERLKATDC